MRIGDRVVVRRTVGQADGRARLTDVLGELRATDAGALTVRRDNGEVVTIPSSEIVAAKTIPAKPTSYRAIAALERACAATWPARHTRRLGAWLLRATAGWTNRANTVLALGDPGVDLDAALGEVAEWYGAQGLPSGFAVPLPLAKRLATDLERRGWYATHTVEVMTADVDSLRGNAFSVRIDSRPSPEWLEVAAANKGDLPEAALSVLGSGDDRAFATIHHDGHLVATGRGAVADDVVVMSLLEVAPSARRQGLARQLIAGLATWAAATDDATRACVQVESDNAPALALYRGLGFTDHHRYVNLRQKS
ncbi:MAG TPA: GNAT family N-acetyltransferase [Stackebrandtia sp.]|uniref:GNAT family N-acetyltransferase n=1 Tax=Stackebrandtia sp. TaxID=2023065 RepID=UPI002D30AA1B|nr:GNAT family N-acetyltransferase [Stackebrandtia sp.]HZE37353.1 GNAT family N-acetyltransferase [Stackebrandtia sp.]